MPSTHTSLHFHLIFATKDRYPLIGNDWKARLHAYLGGLIRHLKGTPREINGMADHVHLLVGLRPTHCLADVLEQVKGVSSQWVHSEIGSRRFAWQTGYGGFTVSPSHLEAVSRYIRNQEIHHRKTTFQEEYLAFLNRSDVRYDERYLW